MKTDSLDLMYSGLRMLEGAKDSKARGDLITSKSYLVSAKQDIENALQELNKEIDNKG